MVWIRMVVLKDWEVVQFCLLFWGRSKRICWWTGERVRERSRSSPWVSRIKHSQRREDAEGAGLGSGAAAKSLQSYPTLCNPRDSSPPGSPVPGILQAKTLECVAIAFSNAWKWKVKVKSLSHVQLLATPWTAAHQAPLSMGFARQEYWSGVPLPSPGAGCGANSVSVTWRCWAGHRVSESAVLGRDVARDRNPRLSACRWYSRSVGASPWRPWLGIPEPQNQIFSCCELQLLMAHRCPCF